VSGPSGNRDESYIFYGDWKDIRLIDRVASQYDPRQRPWYRAAMQGNDIILSNAYGDAPPDSIGLTMSKRVMSPSGELIGVVAADVSLDALSVFLNAMQIGANGRVFVLDETNHVVGASRNIMLPSSAADNDNLISDQIMAKAIQQWQGSQSAAFEFKSPLPKKLYEKAPKYVQRWLTEIEKDLKSVSFERHEDYLASFSRFPLEGGRSWTIGILVSKEDILSPLYANSLRVVMLGLGVILILFAVLMYVSRCLSRPMKAVVKEANSLRNLELSEPFETTSKITEIQQLITAVDSMSNSLRAFDRFVPRKLVTNIVDNGKNTNLSARQAEISVLVARIDNFSQMLTLNPAPDVLQYLNLYFDRLTAVVHDNRGLVDRYVEDAMCAIWNAPISDPVHLENACRAVLACHEASMKLAQECLEGEVPHFHAKFGLHIGTAVLGTVGSFDRVRYTAMGSVVQFATNLEYLNSVYGTNILVSENVVDRITPQFVTRPVDMVMVDGQDYPMKIHELLAERRHLQKKGQLTQTEQMCEDWSYALGLYFAGQWAEAIRAFEGYNNKYPDDPLTPLFLKRSEDYQFDPPPNWDGAQKNQDK
jgi:adenylate cyclase